MSLEDLVLTCEDCEEGSLIVSTQEEEIEKGGLWFATLEEGHFIDIYLTKEKVRMLTDWLLKWQIEENK